MKKFCFLFSLIFLSVFMFAGCSFLSISGDSGVDTTVNMEPRKISSFSSNNFEDIVSGVAPAVVGISAQYSNAESVGSGVSVAPNGYILTNSHVVSGANKIVIYLANKTSARANLVWEDKAMDLAIIKTDASLPYLALGDSTNVKAGEDVIAIGTPLTLQFKHTTTKGIISATNRTIEVENDDGTVSYLQNLIQHDSSINPGNSGGPLINASGEVIGINTLKVTDAEGLGFAIPIEVAVPVINQILKNGSYQTPYLGLFGFDATIANFYNKTLETDGVYILNLDSNGPASKSGLAEGDIITKLNDIQTDTMLELRTSVYNFNVGDTVEITYLRNGVENKTNLVLSGRE